MTNPWCGLPLLPDTEADACPLTLPIVDRLESVPISNGVLMSFQRFGSPMILNNNLTLPHISQVTCQ